MMEIAERFELRERIGGGVTTDVYRAHDRKLEQDVVLRLLRDDVVGDDYVERVQREAEAASDIRHPNVVGILDHGVIDGRPFVARELVDGATLEDVLARRGPLPEDEARRIAEQIARGLEAAHERGVLHRDLNSGNVFITNDGTAKVVDFGMPSTPRHPAPEQAAGNTIDERADVYGLGAVLYQMLTGHIPRGRPVPPRRLVKGVSKPTNALVMRALEKDPPLRYPTAAAIADELRPRETAEGRAAVVPVVAPAATTVAIEPPPAAPIESTVAAAPVEPPPPAPVEPAAMAAPTEPPTAAPVEPAAAVEPPAATTPIEPPAPVPIESARVEPLPRVEPRVPVPPVRPIPVRTVPERAVPRPRERVEPIPIPIKRSASRADPTERIARPARSRRRALPAALLALLTLPLLLALLVGAGNLARPRAPETAVLSATTTPVATATATMEPAVVPTPLATLIPPVETTPAPTPVPVATPAPPPPVVAPPPAAVAPPPAPPQPPAPVAPNSASATVRSFYELIEQERFDEAAALWSASMKANFPPSTNIYGRFDRTRQIVIRSISPVATNTGGATVAIDILEVLDSGVTRRWIGQWQLVWDGARWLMDSPSLRAG